MGAEFSLLPRQQLTPSTSVSTRTQSSLRSQSSSTSKNNSPKRRQLSPWQFYLRTNTLANRSSTNVATHVALSRLAETLSTLSLIPRRKLIAYLRISPQVLKQAAKYHPTRAFGRHLAEREKKGQQTRKNRTKKVVSFKERPEMIEL